MSTEITSSKFSADEARQFTDDLKLDYVLLQGKIAQAFKGKIWIALGYETWTDYICAEFGGLRIRPPKERELEAFRELDAAQMTTRQIAATYGIHHTTVHRKLQAARKAAEGIGGPNELVANATPGCDQVTPSIPQQRLKVNSEGADVSDENDPPHLPGPSHRPPSEPDEHVVEGQSRARNYGSRPLATESGEKDPQVRDKSVKDVIRAYNGTGTSDAVQIKRTALELTEFLRSEMVPAEAWDQDELAVVAEDTIDTIKVLQALLLVMARDNRTGGISLAAIRNAEIRDHLADAIQNLKELAHSET